MTDQELAYNKGLFDASTVLRAAIDVIPARHALDGPTLTIIAEAIDDMKFPDLVALPETAA